MEVLEDRYSSIASQVRLKTEAVSQASTSTTLTDEDKASTSNNQQPPHVSIIMLTHYHVKLIIMLNSLSC